MPPFSLTNQTGERISLDTAELKTGDAISFIMAVTQKDFWIENVKKIWREEVDVAEPDAARGK
jgi:hypothetical protein